MKPEYWQKIKSLLEEAIEQDPAHRKAFLNRACGDDLILLNDVESFLGFHSIENDQLENGGFSFPDPGQEVNSAAAFVGKEIGRYRIVGELGSGGMGTVFLGERSDGAFEQKVAVKLIKRGMDSDAVINRFMNERRILASLEHPNIARLLDGGTTDDGIPYFVMEYVEGEPILEYCEAQGLTVDERLRLFCEVASAVSYAHQNLVIHRDLKPTNILVGSDGTPKLLDFGIAKLLTAGNGGIITATQQMVFTPDYASPEQVLGKQLTTSTDVYSLGIVLYELLTGGRPYKTAGESFGEVVRAVCEVMPSPPSRFARKMGSRLKGDLDAIVLKSLTKEPEKRYSSVERFSNDIHRHLSHLPISAGGSWWAYRLQKFIGRHRLSVASAGVILIVLVLGLSMTLYQAGIAGQQRAKAERRFNDVRRLANSLMFEINDKIKESPIQAREMLVSRALEYLDSLARESGDDVELQAELATAYERVGLIQAEIFNPGLGKTSASLASHKKSLDLRLAMFATDPANVIRGMDVIKSRMFVGDVYSMSGEIALARGEYEQSIDLANRLLISSPENIDLMTALSRSYARLGQNILRSGSLSAALDNYEKSREISSRLLSRDPQNNSRKRSLSAIFNYIGYVKLQMLLHDEAIQYFYDSLRLNQELLAADPENANYIVDTASGHLWLGIANAEAGKAREALPHLIQALQIETSILKRDPANFGIRNGVADCEIELGKVLLIAGETDEALKNLKLAEENYRAVWKVDAQNMSARRQIVLTRRHIADALSQKGNHAQAQEMYRQAIDEYAELIINDPGNNEWLSDLAICKLHLGQLLIKLGRREPGLELIRTSTSLFETLITHSPENATIDRDLQTAKSFL